MQYKSIDINQRIPLDVLYVALDSFLNDSYNEAYILEQLKLEFKGENRIKKSLRIVNKVILKSPLIEFIENHKAEIKQAIKKKQDRNYILIALLNSSFSFAFDTLQLLGKFLSVQDLVNGETIKKSLSSIYGGNRATEIAMYSVIPMFIEAGLIIRPKQGLYQKNEEVIVNSEVVYKVFTESFKSIKSISNIQEYQLRDPYFLFLN
jgi:hypothetical protein